MWYKVSYANIILGMFYKVWVGSGRAAWNEPRSVLMVVHWAVCGSIIVGDRGARDKLGHRNFV